MSTAARRLEIVHPRGPVDYRQALEWQRRLARARIQGALDDDLLILLEHPHVITIGRGGTEANVVATRDALARRGVEAIEIERGGDVTYHGPGQLVGYPILDLSGHRKDLHWYLRRLEEALIGALADLGIEGARVPGYTGVWVDDRKIASIGVHVSRWVTWHGFALNVTTDLSYFDLIVPCGIDAVKMTSIQREAGSDLSVETVGARVADRFARTFGLRPEIVSDPDALLRGGPPAGRVPGR